MAPSSNRLKLVLGALGAIAATYCVAAMALTSVARWAESRYDAYPYIAGEDPVRFLLPTIQSAGPADTVLLGPSSLGEALHYEDLVDAWGGRVLSDGISDGTLNDINLVLEMLDPAKGSNWSPGRMVLGLDPRVLVNTPRHFGPNRVQGSTAYLIDIVNNYSSRFEVVPQPDRSALKLKDPAESILAKARFYLTKQQPRYRTGALALVESALDSDATKAGWQERMVPFRENFRFLASKGNVKSFRELIARHGFAEAALTWMRAYRSPYTSQFYFQAAAKDIRILMERDWQKVFDWSPDREGAMVREHLSRIAEYAGTNRIELVVVHLPLHDLIREGVPPATREWLRDAVASELPGARIIDLSDAVPGSNFVDNVHVDPRGAAATTSLLVAAVPNGPAVRN